MRHLLLTTAISVLLVSSPAFAETEVELLRKQVKLLEARLDQIEKQQKSVPASSAPAPRASSGSAIEQRVAVVERKQEVADDAAKAAAEKTPTVEVGSKGFAITSPDKQYSVRMRAYAQVDNRTFLDNSNTSNVDTFLIRSARPVIDAKLTDYFAGRLMLDFGGGTSRLLDAYFDFKPVPDSKLFTLRAGKLKSPLGLERWQSEQEILFVERGMATNLVPFRETGVMAYGDIIPDQLEYQLMLANGAVDLGDNNTDVDDNKELVGRVFAHPLRWSILEWARGLGVGVAGSYGDRGGSTTTPNLMDGYRTPGQARFFTYRSGGTAAYADGTQWRINPQAYYYNGPFSLLGEYVVTGQDITRTGTTDTLTNTAWSAIATYVLTGEDANFDGVKVVNAFAPSKGQWGAFEVLGRVGRLDVDSDAFPLFADDTVSASQANEYTAGLTWYLNNSVKVNFNYSYTTFEGGAAGGTDREDEKVLLTRTQFRF
ncbi:MAG: porin [Rickettsiales bacterium]|nr:porin [Rickettsiales bacterium]